MLKTLKEISQSALAILIFMAPMLSDAEVTFDRILNASNEPENWLTYNGGYNSQRFSILDQVNQTNVENLKLQWTLQNQVFGAWQSNPIVADGIMYVTERPNTVIASRSKCFF